MYVFLKGGRAGYGIDFVSDGQEPRRQEVVVYKVFVGDCVLEQSRSVRFITASL